MPVSADSDFRWCLARQAEAEKALVAGDVAPRLALWTRNDPVSLLGAWGPNKVGWDAVSRTFHWVADRLGEGTSSDFRFNIDVAEAIGDMAYTVGFERFNSIGADGTVEPVTVRVTHVYRREDGEWKIVHRHGDRLPRMRARPRPDLAAGRGWPAAASACPSLTVAVEFAGHTRSTRPELSNWANRRHGHGDRVRRAKR